MSNAPCTPKSFTTSKALLDILKNACYTIVPKVRELATSQEYKVGQVVNIGWVDQVDEVKFLAVGGYNFVFTVKLKQGLLNETVQDSDSEGRPDFTGQIEKFVLRLPRANSLVPYQVTNEVAMKRFVKFKLPHISVPHVFLYNATDCCKTSFIVEQYAEGSPLRTAWSSLTLAQKDVLAQQLARITVDLAEVRMDKIGGLDPTDFSLAPTVEGSKIFKGRNKFHRNECYPIGPYRSTKEYMLACFDKEIYYYTHATDDIDMSLFEDTSVGVFLDQLREQRKVLAMQKVTDEPFALCHSDLHGGNVLVLGDTISAVLDWEFSGFYPLSEILSEGIDVVKQETEELEEENYKWYHKIRHLIRQEVEKRAWTQADIDLLLGGPRPELGRARTEMFP